MLTDQELQDNRYQIVEYLFSSGFVEFYRIKNTEDQKLYIIKKINTEHTTVLQADHLMKENNIISTIPKCNVILQYSHSIIRDQYPILVYEDFPDCQLLSSYITQKKVTTENFLTIAMQLGKGLKVLHNNHVIYKAVTPNHILINPKTGDIKYFQFYHASTLLHENIEPNVTDLLCDMIYYISPEYTGRTNRLLDWRTDFYSLGMTFYHLLVGHLPFEVPTDISEVIYQQLTRVFQSPREIDDQIPQTLSDIVVKLLSKNVEDRYQNAEGLLKDLERCQQQWLIYKTINPFPLGENSWPAHFQISQKLYRREQDIQKTNAVLNRVVKGTGEILLITGPPGIGKTTLAQHMETTFMTQGALFITGKFQHSQHNIAYKLNQILEASLLKQLHERNFSKEEILQQLLTTLGDDADIFLEFAPQIRKMIGQEIKPSHISDSEKTKRLQHAVQKFVQFFSTAQHPLIVFLDDLQWADQQTLDMLCKLLEKIPHHFLLIGAYRDNELYKTHLTKQWINTLSHQNTNITTITIKPFTQTETHQFLADTLHSTAEHIQPFGVLLYEATLGNPFEMSLLLQTLYDQQQVILIQEKKRWYWQFKSLENVFNTIPNILDLLQNKIKQLSDDQRHLLKLVVALNKTDKHCTLDVLSTILTHQSRQKVSQLLQSLQKNGFLKQTQSYFSFVHNRIKEIVQHVLFKTDQLPETKLHDEHQSNFHLLLAIDPQIHLKIGRALMQIDSDDSIAIVEHLNVAKNLIVDPKECLELAKLNLQAASRSKTTGAYSKYAEYLEIAKKCLGENHWEIQHKLSFLIYTSLIDAYILLNQHDCAESIIQSITQYTNPQETAEIIYFCIMLNTIKGYYQKALHQGIKALESLGIYVYTHDLEKVLREKLAHAEKLLLSKLSLKTWDNLLQPEQLIPLLHMPEMQKPKKQLASKLFGSMFVPAYFTSALMFSVMIVEAVLLTLENGVTVNSSYSFVAYGVILANVQKKYRQAYAFGDLGIRLSERFKNKTELSKACHFFGNMLQHWIRPLQEAKEVNIKGYQAGIAAGDWQFAGYIHINMSVYSPFCQGHYLPLIFTAAKEAKTLYQNTKNYLTLDLVRGILLILNNLLEKTNERNMLKAEQDAEDDYLDAMKKAKADGSIGTYYIIKAQRSYIYNDYTLALQCIELSTPKLHSIAGHFCEAEYNFYSSLSLIMCYKKASLDKQTEYLEQIKANQVQMEKWAQYCPENFRHKFLLVTAEFAQIENKPIWNVIVDTYDKAIQLAEQNGFIQDAALANECAGRFLLFCKRKTMAQGYLENAYRLYHLWGAYRKIQLLATEFTDSLKYYQIISEEKKPSKLLVSVTPSHSNVSSLPSWSDTSSVQSSTDQSHSNEHNELIDPIDIRSMIETSQIFATEVQFETLLPKIIHIIVKTAGAQKALLFLEQKEELLLQAEYNQDLSKTEVLQSIPLNELSQCSRAIVQSVHHTQKQILSHHAYKDPQWLSDEYIKTYTIRSLLCMPITLQGTLIGILYLENNITDSAFTQKHIVLLRFLSSFISIALKNAERYQKEFAFQQTLEKLVEERTHALQESERHYRAISEIAPVGICKFNAEGQIPLSANSYLLELYGIDLSDSFETIQQELFKNNAAKFFQAWQKAVHPDDRQKTSQFWYKSVKKQKSFSTEYRLRLPDHKIIWVIVNSKPIFGEDGQLKFWINTTIDITQQKHLEQEEREKERQLLTRFVRNICHEIRNPLQGIISNIELLTDDIQTARKSITNLIETIPPISNKKILIDTFQEMKQKIKNMTLSSQHQKNILDTVLTLHRLDAGEEKIYAVPILLNHTIHQVIDEMQGTAKQKDLKLLEHICPDENIYIKCDPILLRRILINFISNGIKYTENGSITLNVNIKRKTNEQTFLVFEIKDTGRGIPQDQLQYVGKLFWRGTHQQEGTGLGVAINKNIIEMLGGQFLPIRSALKQGTTFSFELPCDNLSPEEIESANKRKEDLKKSIYEDSSPNKSKLMKNTEGDQSELTNNDQNFNNIHILVVDDDMIIRNTLIMLLNSVFNKTPELKNKTAMIDSAENGVIALKKFLEAEQPYTIIFMDVLMPEIDGLLSTQLLRLFEKNLHSLRAYIVGLSGNALEEDQQKALDIGMDDYVKKPIYRATIVQIITNILKKSISPVQPLPFDVTNTNRLFYNQPQIEKKEPPTLITPNVTPK